MSNNQKPTNPGQRPSTPVQADKSGRPGQGTGAPQKGSNMGKGGNYDKQGQKPGQPNLGQKGQGNNQDRNR